MGATLLTGRLTPGAGEVLRARAVAFRQARTCGRTALGAPGLGAAFLAPVRAP